MSECFSVHTCIQMRWMPIVIHITQRTCRRGLFHARSITSSFLFLLSFSNLRVVIFFVFPPPIHRQSCHSLNGRNRKSINIFLLLCKLEKSREKRRVTKTTAKREKINIHRNQRPFFLLSCSCDISFSKEIMDTSR